MPGFNSYARSPHLINTRNAHGVLGSLLNVGNVIQAGTWVAGSVGGLSDTVGNTVGAVGGVGHVAGGAYEQRRGYHYAARGNANRAEMYSRDTDEQLSNMKNDQQARQAQSQNGGGAALDYVMSSEEFQNQGKSTAGASPTDDTKDLDGKEARLLRRIARQERKGHYDKADQLAEKLLDHDQKKFGGEHFNDVNTATAQQGNGVQKAAPIDRKAETEKFVDAMIAANTAAPGSDAQTAALTAAHHAAENCKGTDGKVHFADTERTFGQGRNAPFFAIGIDPKTGHDYATHDSPEAAMKAASNALAGQTGVGQAVNPQTIDAIGQGRKAADAGQQQNGNNQSVSAEDKQNSTPEDLAELKRQDAKPHGKMTIQDKLFVLDAGDGTQAPVYKGHANLVKADEMPRLGENQVKSVQRMIGTPDDGLWGKDSQAKFVAACEKAGVDPKTVDFTNPKDPETVKLVTALRGHGSDKEVIAFNATAGEDKNKIVFAEVKREEPATGVANNEKTADAIENNVLTSKTGASVVQGPANKPEATQIPTILTVGADNAREVPDEQVAATAGPKTLENMAADLKKVGVGEVKYTNGTSAAKPVATNEVVAPNMLTELSKNIGFSSEQISGALDTNKDGKVQRTEMVAGLNNPAFSAAQTAPGMDTLLAENNFVKVNGVYTDGKSIGSDDVVVKNGGNQQKITTQQVGA